MNGATFAERLERLERADKTRTDSLLEFAELQGRHTRELVELRAAVTTGSAAVLARVDALHTKVEKLTRELEGDVRPALTTLTNEVEDSSEHLVEAIQKEADTQERLKQLSVFVEKLRQERAQRKAAEKERDDEKRRALRFARRLAATAVVAAFATVGAALAGAALAKCGVQQASQIELRP